MEYEFEIDASTGTIIEWRRSIGTTILQEQRTDRKKRIPLRSSYLQQSYFPAPGYDILI